ncbi:MAG: FIG001341: Probable Fe(2+)-trafficking protein YggX, partial [uncultured Thermomicrobiales bacterium]
APNGLLRQARPRAPRPGEAPVPRRARPPHLRERLRRRLRPLAAPHDDPHQPLRPQPGRPRHPPHPPRADGGVLLRRRRPDAGRLDARDRRRRRGRRREGGRGTGAEEV